MNNSKDSELDGKEYLAIVDEALEQIGYMEKTGCCYVHKDTKLKPVGELVTWGEGTCTQDYICPVEGCDVHSLLDATPEAIAKFENGLKETTFTL